MCLSGLCLAFLGRYFPWLEGLWSWEGSRWLFPWASRSGLSSWVETSPLLAWVSAPHPLGASCWQGQEDWLLIKDGGTGDFSLSFVCLWLREWCCGAEGSGFCAGHVSHHSPSVPALSHSSAAQLGLVPTANPLFFWPLAASPQVLQPTACAQGFSQALAKKSPLLRASDRAVNIQTLLQQLAAPRPLALRKKGAGLGTSMQWRDHLVCWGRHWWGRGEVDTPIALS